MAVDQAGSFMSGFDLNSLAADGISSFAEGLASGAPSNAQAYGGTLGGSPFDGSGWNVNFGSGRIDSNREQAGELSQYMPYVIVGGVLLIAFVYMKRKK